MSEAQAKTREFKSNTKQQMWQKSFFETGGRPMKNIYIEFITHECSIIQNRASQCIMPYLLIDTLVYDYRYPLIIYIKIFRRYLLL